MELTNLVALTATVAVVLAPPVAIPAAISEPNAAVLPNPVQTAIPPPAANADERIGETNPTKSRNIIGWFCSELAISCPHKPIIDKTKVIKKRY